MRTARLLLALALLGLVSSPAWAEARWLACKFNDTAGKTQNFLMVFDDMRGTAALFDGAAYIEGTSTSINFQSLRARFPAFGLTYNRNDGALSLSMLGSIAGMVTGECRRTAPPQGAPPWPQ